VDTNDVFNRNILQATAQAGSVVFLPPVTFKRQLYEKTGRMNISFHY